MRLTPNVIFAPTKLFIPLRNISCLFQSKAHIFYRFWLTHFFFSIFRSIHAILKPFQKTTKITTDVATTFSFSFHIHSIFIVSFYYYLLLIKFVVVFFLCANVTELRLRHKAKVSPKKKIIIITNDKLRMWNRFTTCCKQKAFPSNNNRSWN